MPQYSYQVLGNNLKFTRGTLAAGNISEAAAALRRQDMAITSLVERKGQPAETAPSVPSVPPLELNSLLMRFSIVKQSDVIILLWQMTALIASGVTITDALAILREQARSKRLKFILSALRREVEAGRSLTEAMRQFPKTFPPTVTSILETGEVTGLLDTAMERVAAYWEERLALLTRIITSSLYPAVILLASLGAIYYLVIHVLPSVIPALEMMGGGGELPWTTAFLLNIAENLTANMAALGIGLGGLAAVGAALYRLPASRLLIDQHKTSLPLLGPVFQYTIVVHFARTLALLLSSGVPVLEALKNTRETISNRAVRKVIDRMIDRVLHGENLSEPMLKAGNYFPPMVGSMVKVGEETGQVDSSLTMVANIYAKLLEERIKKLISLMEPLLILVLGGVVGFVAAALISAIMAGYGGLAGG